MAAMSATLFNPEMAEFHGRLKKRGKPHKVAVTAVMRKLIVTANALLRDRRLWEDRGRRRLTPARAVSRGARRVRNESGAPAGLPRHARMAPACGRGCGKPGTGPPKTAGKGRIRA